MQQAILTWISTDDALPEMDKVVLIHRYGGKNNHDDVLFGYRQHKYGTRDEWEWLDNNGSYWGHSCDGSTVMFWADMPAPPKTPNLLLDTLKK